MNSLLAIALLFPISQGTPAADDDPAVAEEIEALKKAVKSKDDSAAVGAVDKLTQRAKGAGPKDRAKIAAGIGTCFDAVRVPAEGQSKNEVFRLYIAAAASLGTLKEDGVKPLLAAIDNRKFRHEIELRSQLIGEAGKTKSPNVIKPLLDLLDDKDYPIISASAAALANFHDGKEPDRKKIVEQIVKHLESVQGAADQNAPDNEGRRKYDAVAPSFMETLAKVTGEEIRQTQGWVKWWNDNKKRKW